MHFFKTLATLALATAAAAQSSTLQITNTEFDIQVGKPFTITYKSTELDQSATILLRRGPSTALTTVETITSSATGGSYDWTPSSTLPSASDYAFEITQGSENNYSKQFSITGGSSTASGYGSVTSASPYVSATLVPSHNTSSYSVVTAPSNYTTSAYPVISGTGYSTGVIPMTRNATFSMATITPTVTPSGTTGAAAATSTTPNAASSIRGSFTLIISVFAAMIFFN